MAWWLAEPDDSDLAGQNPENVHQEDTDGNWACKGHERWVPQDGAEHCGGEGHVGEASRNLRSDTWVSPEDCLAPRQPWLVPLGLLQVQVGAEPVLATGSGR